MKKFFILLITAVLAAGCPLAAYGGGASAAMSHLCTSFDAVPYGATLMGKGKNNKKLSFKTYIECRENVEKCRITVVLQVYEDGRYINEVTAAYTENGSTCTWSKIFDAETGKRYRAKVKFESYDKDDKLTETKYIVSNSIKAP